MVVALPVHVPEDDDEEPVQEHVVLRVERMDGLRVDRLTLQHLVTGEPAPTADGGGPA